MVWPALAAEANFPNICLLGTFRTCVETSGALEWGNLGLKSVRCELKNVKFVLPEYTVYKITTTLVPELPALS